MVYPGTAPIAHQRSRPGSTLACGLLLAGDKTPTVQALHMVHVPLLPQREHGLHRPVAWSRQLLTCSRRTVVRRQRSRPGPLR